MLSRLVPSMCTGFGTLAIRRVAGCCLGEVLEIHRFCRSMFASTAVDGVKGSIREYSGLMLNFGRKMISGMGGGGGGRGPVVGGKFSRWGSLLIDEFGTTHLEVAHRRGRC